MLKKTITYTDFNDEEITEDLYFNLTKSELVEMQLTTDGGFDKLIESIVNARNLPELTKLFKRILLMSYGEKSADGKRFMKSDDISKAFEQSAAYDVLFMELLDDEKASAFINGLMPKDLVAEVEKMKKEENKQ